MEENYEEVPMISYEDMIKHISKAIYYETTIQAMKDKTTPITVVTK